MSIGNKLGKVIVGVLPKPKPGTYLEEEYYIRNPRKGEYIENINDLVEMRLVTRYYQPIRLHFSSWDVIKYLAQDAMDITKYYVTPWKWFK